jgi:septal ring factor EnvC (AmiA/AmiB activator)
MASFRDSNTFSLPVTATSKPGLLSRLVEVVDKTERLDRRAGLFEVSFKDQAAWNGVIEGFTKLQTDVNATFKADADAFQSTTKELRARVMDIEQTLKKWTSQLNDLVQQQDNLAATLDDHTKRLRVLEKAMTSKGASSSK